MDSVGGAAIRWNTDAIKEPRGFIKFIELIIAIFAFATTTSSSSKSSFYFMCEDQIKTSDNSLSWGYPFKIDQSTIEVDFCNQTETKSYSPYGDFSAPSQFYVFVGVMAFLYCIGAVILYVCFDDKYRKFDKIPIVDFIVSCVFVLLWLISSSAWATGISQLKEYTNPEDWLETFLKDETTNADNAVITSTGNFATLNVSLIFGFLNMCVWAGNLWFLYKETKWFKVETEHPQTSPSETPQQV